MPVVNEMYPGQIGYNRFKRKFGRVFNIANESVVWDGNSAYDGWLTTEEDISIVSTSEQDKLGGTGTSYIQFTGQGVDGIEKTYSMLLNGTTPVLLSATDPGVKFSTIYTAQTFNVEGLNKSPTITAANTGTISIKSVSTNKTMAIIRPNLGRTQMMIWRCPKDHFAELLKVSLYPVSGKPVVVKFMVRVGGINNSWFCMGQVDTERSNEIEWVLPEYILPGTDFCLVCIPGQPGTNMSAQMWINQKEISQYNRLLAEGSL